MSLSAFTNEYENVEPESIKSAADSIEGKLKEANSKLTEIEGGLGDGVWKASAKQSLIDGFGKLKGPKSEAIT